MKQKISSEWNCRWERLGQKRRRHHHKRASLRRRVQCRRPKPKDQPTNCRLDPATGCFYFYWTPATRHRQPPTLTSLRQPSAYKDHRGELGRDVGDSIAVVRFSTLRISSSKMIVTDSFWFGFAMCLCFVFFRNRSVGIAGSSPPPSSSEEIRIKIEFLYQYYSWVFNLFYFFTSMYLMKASSHR